MQIYINFRHFENEILQKAVLFRKWIKTGMYKNPLSIAAAGSGVEIKILSNI